MNRREVMAAAVVAPHAHTDAASPSTADVQGLLDRYVGFGSKASGGEGDAAAGAWLEAALRSDGFTVERQAFDAPFFEPATARLETEGAAVDVRPQALVVPTSAAGLWAPLALMSPWSPPRDLAGCVVVTPLPHARWSSATAAPVREAVATAVRAGAVAVVLVTTGPTGEALALNADVGKPLADRPVALLAPRDAAPVLAAAEAGRPARLTVTGQGGRRSAFNLVGRLERGAGRWLVVSTPRSGWGVCAGERGGGVAVWRLLAAWAARRSRLDLLFLCNSGHEYENLGAEHALRAAAPPVDETALWVHLGANVAARDQHDLGPALVPLPSADPQRYLLASPDLLPSCCAAFRGQPGLEAPLPATPGNAAGELGPILAAGHRRVVGVYGAHRFHHAAGDDGRCVSAALTLQAFTAFREVVARATA